MKVLFYPAISLDGFIARPDGDSNWVTEEDEGLFSEEVKKSGCVIVGSKTFQQYKGVIYPLPTAVTFVCTSRTEQSDNASVQYVGGDVEQILRNVESKGFNNVVLSGGAETNGRFAMARAINEMIISIYPLMLGEGLPIFGKYRPKLQLALLSTRQLACGVIQNRYEVVDD